MANSERHQKLYEAIKDKHGLPASIAMTLAISSGAGSVDEIRFLADLILSFRNIRFQGYANGAKGVILRADYSDGGLDANYYIDFSFQQRFRNAAPKTTDWRVDLAIYVYSKFPKEAQLIHSLALEYDGHPSHYLETKVKSQMVRDAYILKDQCMQVSRISADMAKDDPGLIKKAIRSSIRFHVKTHKMTVAETARLAKNGVAILRTDVPENKITGRKTRDPWVDCPICKGKGEFGYYPCKLCESHGTLPTSKLSSINIADFFEVRCPACGLTPRKSCTQCNGRGTMDHLKALQYTIKHYRDN